MTGDWSDQWTPDMTAGQLVRKRVETARVRKLLIFQEGFCEVHPTRVFRRKSPDLLDCKGVEFFAENKEPATVC
jgi:hypothetical protein